MLEMVKGERGKAKGERLKKLPFPFLMTLQNFTELRLTIPTYLLTHQLVDQLASALLLAQLDVLRLIEHMNSVHKPSRL